MILVHLKKRIDVVKMNTEVRLRADSEIEANTGKMKVMFAPNHQSAGR
jgi:hypothetical protein